MYQDAVYITAIIPHLLYQDTVYIAAIIPHFLDQDTVYIAAIIPYIPLYTHEPFCNCLKLIQFEFTCSLFQINVLIEQLHYNCLFVFIYHEDIFGSSFEHMQPPFIALYISRVETEWFYL